METTMMAAGPATAAPASAAVSLMGAVACGVLVGLMLRALFRRKPAEAMLDRLTYRDVVKYFVEHRPAATLARKAALLRQKVGRQFYVQWCYLDAEGNLCVDGDGQRLGQTAWVRSFDDELQGLFGQSDLVVFE
jgi:hypothetical protein